MLRGVRVALISDQHGNDVAFAAAAAEIERVGVDEIICLGDVAQGGAQPAETLDRLRGLGCATVMGNADAFLLEPPADSPEPVTVRQLEVREWTLSQLDSSHLDFLRSFQPTVRREYAGVAALLFHGSPRSYDDILLPESQEVELVPYRGHGADLLAGGHTHTQWTRRIDGALFVNPGSVGLAYDHFQWGGELEVRPVAQYALVAVDEAGLAVELRQVPYSTAAVRAAAEAGGRPYAAEWAGQWDRA